MSDVKQKRQIDWVTEYIHRFDNVHDRSKGSSFPCDAQGKLIEPEHQKWFEKAKADPECEYMGIIKWERKVVRPAIVRCACGRDHELWDVVTNEVGCGRFYNGSGAELRHPREWGEETGERFDDHGNYIGGGDDTFFD
jgi:hypothetical protein